MSNISQKDRDLFENLFILELANNHWGSLERGLKIIKHHARVIRYNNVKAAIKLQFRDVEEFIHPDFKGNADNRYIKKTEDTKLCREDFAKMVEEIKNQGCIPMATPFDEASVDLCIEFDMPIFKLASSDVNDWVLIERIASTRRPTIASSGGASEKDLDDLVHFFEKRDIPLAINHCVAMYPCEDECLELDQIDYLQARYPKHVIGLSSHEYQDWSSSMLISYAKGARTWERHVDIEDGGIKVSPYCSLPSQCEIWYQAFKKAAEMCGGNSQCKRVISRKEIEYLDALVRGVYAKRAIEPGYEFDKDSLTKDFFLAIPLLKGQLSCREVMNGEKLILGIQPNEPLTINHVDGPCNENESLKQLILNRGL